MKGIFNTSLNQKIKKKKNLLVFLGITGYSLTLIAMTSIQVRNGIIGDVINPIIKKIYQFHLRTSKVFLLI